MALAPRKEGEHFHCSGANSRLKGLHRGDVRFPLPKLVGSPEVPFVGGILDVVTDVVEHPVSSGTVSGIKHL